MANTNNLTQFLIYTPTSTSSPMPPSFAPTFTSLVYGTTTQPSLPPLPPPSASTTNPSLPHLYRLIIHQRRICRPPQPPRPASCGGAWATPPSLRMVLL